MSEEKQQSQPQPDVVERRGALQTAVDVSAVLAPIVAPIVSQVTGHLLDRPKDETPQVVLPPGVERE